MSEQVNPDQKGRPVPEPRVMWAAATEPRSLLCVVAVVACAGAAALAGAHPALVAALVIGAAAAGLALGFWILRCPQEVVPLTDEELLHSAVTAAPMPMFAIDIKAIRILHVNEYMCDLLGYPAEELVGREGLDLTPEWAQVRAKQGFQRLLRYGRSEARAVPLVRRDGSIIWLDTSARMVPGCPGHVALVALHDITERRDMEEELVRRTDELRRANRELAENLALLAASEARHRALFTQAMDAVLLVDAHSGIVRDANPQAVVLLGSDRNDVVGQELSRLQGNTWPSLSDVVREVAERKGVRLPELPFDRSDGQRVYLDVSGSLVTYEDDCVVQLVLHDVTDRRGLREALERTNRELQRQREALEAANAQLSEVNRAKTQFLANMSHEIRTPLNAINGFAELLADDSYGPLDDDRRAFVNHIIEAGQHLLQLINDVIDLAKVEAGAIELELEPADLNRLAEQAIRVIQGAARKKNKPVRLHPLEGEAMALVDPRRIKQVLFNLLSNAVRYSGEGTPVDVYVERVDDALRVSVVDQGPGIAPEDQQRIFEEFVRVGEARQHHSGAGLGLPLSRNLVHMHGGEMGVDSELGRGSSFWFTVPVATRPETSPESIAHVVNLDQYLHRA